jgi:hypothetical protein
MRTARSRTSGEKRFDFLLMAPSSQSVELPQNPGRFMFRDQYHPLQIQLLKRVAIGWRSQHRLQAKHRQEIWTD